MPTLHVVVPIFEERATLEECLRRVVAAPLPAPWRCEIALIDDGSSPEALRDAEEIADRLDSRLLRHDRNRGKGAALRTGFTDVLRRADETDAVVVQDADLEYDPTDFARLLAPIIDGEADVVFGNRWGDGADPRLGRRLHRAMNGGLTRLSNLATGLRVRDMECCYKLFRAPALRRLVPFLSEDRFGIEPQLAAAVARAKLRVAEVPVGYRPRSFSEGKKIRPRDGLRALWVILRERCRTTPPDRSA